MYYYAWESLVAFALEPHHVGNKYKGLRQSLYAAKTSDNRSNRSQIRFKDINTIDPMIFWTQNAVYCPFRFTITANLAKMREVIPNSR